MPPPVPFLFVPRSGNRILLCFYSLHQPAKRLVPVNEDSNIHGAAVENDRLSEAHFRKTIFGAEQRYTAVGGELKPCEFEAEFEDFQCTLIALCNGLTQYPAGPVFTAFFKDPLPFTVNGITDAITTRYHMHVIIIMPDLKIEAHGPPPLFAIQWVGKRFSSLL